jgi:hypothetical protein
MKIELMLEDAPDAMREGGIFSFEPVFGESGKGAEGLTPRPGWRWPSCRRRRSRSPNPDRREKRIHTRHQLSLRSSPGHGGTVVDGERGEATL